MSSAPWWLKLVEETVRDVSANTVMATLGALVLITMPLMFYFTRLFFNNLKLIVQFGFNVLGLLLLKCVVSLDVAPLAQIVNDRIRQISLSYANATAAATAN